MSEIKKYKKYLNFKANPRYLSRDFIVPLYTGTEPDIVPEASVEQLETVQEFNDGGRVGFELGGRTYKINKPLTTEQQNRIKKNYPNADFSKFKYGFSEKDTNNYKNVYSFVKRGKTKIENRLEKLKEIVLESNLKPFESLNEKQAAIKAGYVSAANLRNRSEVRDVLNQLIPLEKKFSNYLNNLMNNLDDIPYQDIVKAGGMNKYISKPFGLTRMADKPKIYKTYMNSEFKEARDVIKLLSNPQVFDTYGKREMFAGEVLDNLDATKSARRLKGGSIGNEIIKTAERSMEAGNKNIKFLTEPGKVNASDIVFEWNGKLYGKDVDEYKGRKVNNLTTDIYKLPEFNEYLDAKTKINDLRKKQVIDPQTKKPITYDQLLRKTYAKGFGKNTSYERSSLELDHLNIKDEPFSNLRPLPAHINQTAGLIKKSISIIDDKDKALRAIGYFIPEDAVENSILKFSDRVLNKNIPVSKTYDVGLRAVTGGSKEYLSPESKITTEGLQEGRTGTESLFKGETQVMTSSGKYRDVSVKERIPKEFNEQKKNTVEYLTNYLNENPEEVKILKDVGIPCRRSTGGKVDVECLAENVVKEVEKLGTGTDLQKASVLNKLNRAVKLGSGLSEEIIGFGRGVVGRTVGPLVALNSALEQWTSGDIKQGFRKIADVLDPTTLVGDPFGFGKSRMEGTQEDIKKIIGEKNYKGFENVKAAADEYNQYLDISKKLERARSASQGAYDPLSPSVDTSYLTDLEKQKSILEKNITGTKYKDVQDNIINYGKNIYQNILKEKPDASESSKYVYKRAAIEKLAGAFGNEIVEMFKDEINESFGPDLNVIDKQPSQENLTDYSYVSAAKGGRIGYKDGTGDPNEKPIIPINPLSDDVKSENIMDTKLTRRQVLGGIGVAAGVPLVAKLIQEGKATKILQAGKLASKIKIEPTEGMYPWFPKLVEKIKKMGEPFEEKELIMEPSYKNSPRPFTSRPPTGEEKLTKHVDGDTTFILREYPDGRIAVDIDSPRNQQSYGQPVSLYYRPKMEFKNYKGEKKIEPPEFKVLEPEPRPFVNGPDDVDITFTEIPKNPERNVVYGDIEAAERFATGKIKNRKIIPVKQSLRNEMEEEPSTFIMRQSGELGSEARPEQIIKIPEEKATGGRVGFSGGGHPAIKFARMITDLLGSLKKDLSFSSHLVKLHGPEVAKKEMISPYRIPEGTNKSKQSDILMRIDEIKQNLPKEYSGLINTLDDIEKNVNNYNYIDASKKGTVLLEKLPDSFNFEKLPQDLFPMEDPLNDAFILFDPKREKMVGRYTMRYAVDPETGKGIIQTYDTYDPASKKFLEEKDWKLIGVDAREESGEITKKGLN